MERVRVPLAGRAYDILVGRGLIRRLAGLLPPELSGRKLAVVADARVAALFGEDLDAGLRSLGGAAAFLEVPPGDASKNFRNLERLCLALIEAGIARDDAVIAFGGGMVGDLAGLAAALSAGDLGVIALFAPADGPTLPLLVQRLMAGYRWDAAAGASLLLLALSFGLFVVFDRLGAGRARR